MGREKVYQLNEKSKGVDYFWLKKRASWCYKDMKRRCENTSIRDYNMYGGKGIKVLISRSDFIEFYFRNFDPSMKCCTVDRIDSGGHYEFSNIRLLDRSENSRIANIVPVTINGIKYSSFTEAGRILGYHQSTVTRWAERAGSRNFIIKRIGQKSNKVIPWGQAC